MDWLCATVTWAPTCPACEPAVSHVGRLFRTWAGLPRLGIAGPRADETGQARDSGSTCGREGHTKACKVRTPATRHVLSAEGWTHRVAGVVTLRLCGAGKSLLWVVVFVVFPDLPKSQTTSPTTAHFCRFLARWSALWAARSLMSAARAGDASIRRFSCHHDPQTTQAADTTGRESAAPVPNGGQVQS